MKDYLAEIVRAGLTPGHARNVAREYLQARILGGWQRAGAMRPLAFQGGTALRFLYALPRYSEDLDFALERPAAGYDFRLYLRAVQTELAAENYAVDVKVNDRKTVQSAFIQFPGLPHELGLSSHRTEKLAVRVEVDTKPPAGAVLATTVVRRHVTLQLQHHDRASLLSGELHAILQRDYLKGRDLYDLLWYLSDPTWPSPNQTLLNNALRQTGWKGRAVSPENWRETVRRRLKTLKWDRALADVRPFLERSAEADLLTSENLMRLLQSERRSP